MTRRKYLSAVSVVLILLVGAVMAGSLVGCGGSSEPQGPELGAAASSFQSDVPPMNPDQKACPVCGNAIKEDVYVEVDDEGTTKRIYFDKEQCKKVFQQNQETQLKRFKAKMQGPK